MRNARALRLAFVAVLLLGFAPMLPDPADARKCCEPPSTTCGKGTVKTSDDVCLPKQCARETTATGKCSRNEFAAKVCAGGNCQQPIVAKRKCPEGFDIFEGRCVSTSCRNDSAWLDDRRAFGVRGCYEELRRPNPPCPSGYVVAEDVTYLRDVETRRYGCQKIVTGETACANGRPKQVRFDASGNRVSYCEPERIGLTCPDGFEENTSAPGLERCQRPVRAPCALTGGLYEYDAAKKKCVLAVEPFLIDQCRVGQTGQCRRGRWRCPRAIGIDNAPKPGAFNREPVSGWEIKRCVHDFTPRCEPPYVVDETTGACVERTAGLCGRCLSKDKDGNCTDYSGIQTAATKSGRFVCHAKADKQQVCSSATSSITSFRHIARGKRVVREPYPVTVTIDQKSCLGSDWIPGCPEGMDVKSRVLKDPNKKDIYVNFCVRRRKGDDVITQLTLADRCPQGTAFDAQAGVCYETRTVAPSVCPTAPAGTAKWVRHKTIASICTRAVATPCPGQTHAQACRVTTPR